ncbi:MAG: acyltransferase [Clostridia bacterium]|nr:acyltransferase [Clostridia bacterium]MBR6860308.1 acyltransferase [Acidaminococcaceae bacterium]
MKPDRIHSLTGLRAVAALTIFCSHLLYLAETPFHGLYSLIDNGRLGVNFFFLLSGFVLALGYSKKLSTYDFARDVRFVKKRMSRIYIPYLITMVLAVPWYIHNAALGDGSLNAGLMILHLLFNIGMVQSVIPFFKYSTSINDVSWFLSTIFILYLLTPGILRLNNKAAKRCTLRKLVYLTAAVVAFYCCVYMVIGQIEFVRFADRGLSIIYRSPLIRLFPFLLGIVAYDIYCLSGRFRIKNASAVEISGIALFLLWWVFADQSGLPTLLTECADMLISMLVVLIFAFSGDGIVSGLLSKEKVLEWGTISLEFYLVHYLIIHYGVLAAQHFGLDKGIAALPLALLFFVLSLYGARLLHSITERLLSVLRKEKT